MDDEKTPGPEPGRSPLPLGLTPEALIWGALFLSVVVIVLQAKRANALERQLQDLRGNYSGVVSVLNTRKPCGCQEQQEGATQNGVTGLHSSASADSGSTPE